MDEFEQNTKTSHVATRAYRAPEIMLLERYYNKPADLWSCGVILGELFKKIERKDQPGRGIEELIFSGDHCFPLSPSTKVKFDSDGLPVTTAHILESVFKLLGSPSTADTAFIQDELALKYICKFKRRDRKDFAKSFPSISAEGLNLLDQLLQFNPYFRPTVDFAVSHPFFDEVRDLSLEFDAKRPVICKFETAITRKNAVSVLRKEYASLIEIFDSRRNSNNKKKNPKCNLGTNDSQNKTADKTDDSNQPSRSRSLSDGIKCLSIDGDDE